MYRRIDKVREQFKKLYNEWAENHSTNRTKKRSPFRSKIAVRLWIIMMLLVIFSIVFMWVVQIFLFEKNYIDATVIDLQTRLQPIIEEVKTTDLAENEELLVSLSKATNNKMIVVDENGLITEMFGMGHRLLDKSSLESAEDLLMYVEQSDEFQQVKKGYSYNRIVRYYDSEPIALEVGIPVIYNQQQSVIILYYKLDQLHTVLSINRSQLIRLSIVLTLIASIFAALLSRYFLKPIRMIKAAVDKLAKGELTASPGLSLNDELGQLSDSVDELSQALQRVEVLRKEVIANVSHELRAPLALIRGYAEMVRDINWNDDEKRNDNLNLIIEEASRMSKMVSDIMDYSQVQAGYIQLKKDQYSLFEIIESEIAHCEKSAVEYNIEIRLMRVQNDMLVYVDAMKICQVMRNLLNNAINHTADGEVISVVVEETDKKIRISVINPGEPISKEDCAIIWERYQRSQHHGGRKKGTGIGLSIVSTYLKAHGMNYGVNCEDGLTKFWFEYKK